MSEVIVNNKNNFGANGGEKAFKKIDDLFKEVKTIGGGIDNLQKKSPKTIKYFTNILNSIHRHPPKTNEGVILPQLERFKIWNRYISESAKKDRAKIMKERKDALKPKKEKVKKPAVKKKVVTKPEVKKPEVKKPVPPPVEEDDESEDEEDARLKRKEITARNDPLTDKLRVVISMKDKILKKVKNDPTLVQGETARKSNKLIGDLVKPILEYIKKLEDDNNIRFSESILDQYQLQLIQNLRSDLKEFMK